MNVTPSAPTDDELLERAKSNDRAATDALVRRYANLVYGGALRRARDPELAADISQAVFVVFLRRHRTICSARSLPSWFLQTTRRVWLEAHRSMRRRAFHERKAARAEPDMNQANAADEPTAILDDAILRLRRGDRELIALRFFQQRDVAEIAAALGIAHEAARKRIDRAVTRLRHLMQAEVPAASVDALLGAAAVSMPDKLLQSCVSLIGAKAGSASAAVFAQGALKTAAMHKLVIVGLIVAACVAAAGVGIFQLKTPKARTIHVPSAASA